MTTYVVYQEVDGIEKSAQDEAGEGTDPRNDELNEWPISLPRNLGDAAEYEQGDTFNGDTSVDGQDAMR